MDPKNIIQEFWENYSVGDLDTTWEKYVSPDLVIHPASGFTFTRQIVEHWAEIGVPGFLLQLSDAA
jgi:hypothetical protein